MHVGAVRSKDGGSPFERGDVRLHRDAQLAGCEAVELPYQGRKLSMLVIMPNPGTFDSFMSDFTSASVAEISRHLIDTSLDLFLPKFSTTQTYSMKEILKRLGVKDAFDAARADFSGINGRRDLSITDVFHRGFISVVEEGTEAAAATAVVTSAGCVISGNSTPPQAVVIDHPFIFLIRDRETGLILFMGKVAALRT